MKASQETVTIGNASYDAMWAEFADGNREETPPDGSMCPEAYVEKFGGTLESVRMMLRRRARAGLLIETKVRIRRGGILRDVLFYTPKKKAA